VQLKFQNWLGMIIIPPILSYKISINEKKYHISNMRRPWKIKKKKKKKKEKKKKKKIFNNLKILKK